MPRHAFQFPKYIRTELKEFINRKINETDKTRFEQESNYVAAFFGKLDGYIFQDENYIIKFTTTIYNDRGAHSAESRLGADFSITATISDHEKKVRKVILFQAKKLEKDVKRKKTYEQIKTMKLWTAAPKIFVIGDSNESPYVYSANKILKKNKCYKFKLAEYVTKRVLTTFDGDTRTKFVEVVQESRLNNLDILVKKRN